MRRPTDGDGSARRSWWWRARNTDVDLWLTLILLPVGLALVFLLTYWR
ncbi:MAG TPA: hypothetical protein VKE22_11970 [Haliangiales bacterium]|nr:hypothetical protein [Haliangiales bacterium]